MARPRTRDSSYNEDEQLHASEELETLYQKPFGSILELEAGSRFRKTLTGARLANRERVWETRSTGALLSPLLRSEKQCVESQEYVVEFTQIVGSTIYPAEIQNNSEKSTEALCYNMGPAES